MADIEERLKSHTNAFDGLLSLIPANKYFEGDTSSSWNKRKQTREESKRAKKAKLDPDAPTTAAEVRAQRLKERQQASEQEAEIGGEDKEENPAASRQQKKQKKQKGEKAQDQGEKSAEDAQRPPEKQKEQQKQQQQQQRQQQPKKDGKGKQKQRQRPGSKPVQYQPQKGDGEGVEEDEEDEDADAASDVVVINGLEEVAGSTSEASNALEESVSEQRSAKPELTAEEKAEKRALLAQRIEALRAKRQPEARNRQELIEARRKKEVARKERKKQMRLQAKVAEQEKKQQQQQQQQGNDRTGLNAEARTPTVPVQKDLSFGRVAFNDGRQLDPTLQHIEAQKRRKGPSDVLGQLKHVEARKRRLENMPEEKQEILQEKDKWQKALKQSSGERVRDDEKLLKKALKRQDQQKKKSAKEWNTRLEGVAMAQQARQKKREENIKARIEQKKSGKKGKRFGKGKPGKGSRAGFEGRMKVKTKGKK